MARVAQLLEGVVERVGIARARARRSFGHARCVGADVVDQCERAARFERTRQAAATNAAGSGKWCAASRQVTRSKLASGNGSSPASACAVSTLVKPARCGELGRLREHFIGDVGGDDARDERREGERRVPGAGRHVEHVPIGLR